MSFKVQSAKTGVKFYKSTDYNRVLQQYTYTNLHHKLNHTSLPVLNQKLMVWDSYVYSHFK